jgi:hypothetical protein
VLVSDNSSSDETEIVCSMFKSKGNFSYVKNSSNLGYDKNVLKLYSSVDTDYIWFFSDDDFMGEPLFDRVLTLIEHDYNGILIDAEVVNPVDGRVKVLSLSGAESDCEVQLSENHLVDSLKWSTLISSLVIKAGQLDIKYLEPLIGTLFIQLPIFWNTCLGGKVYFLSSVKIIKYIAEKNYFYSNVSEVWLWKLMVALQYVDVDRSVVRRSHRNIFNDYFFSSSGLPAHYVLSRIDGCFGPKYSLKRIFNNIDCSVLLKTFLFILSLVPLWVFKSIKHARSIVRW